MAQVKPALTLDVNVGASSHVGVGGSGTSTTPRAHQNAVNNKIQNQVQASTFGPQSDYQSYASNEYEQQPDNGGFSSDDDAQDVYAAGTSRLKAGSSSAGAQASAQQARYHQQQLSNGSEFDQSEDGDVYGHDAYAQNGHYQHHMADGIHDEMVYEDEDDAEDMEDDESDLSSSPSIPDENIDFDLVYALHNFVATVEGQATVHKGNSLTLLDDSNSYWWLVRVLRTQEVGYIPAENIETPFERLARLNKHRNVDLTSATEDDHVQVPEKIFTSHLVKARNASGTAGVSQHSGKLSALSRRAQGAPAPLTKEQKRNKKGVAFGPPTYLEHSGDEYSDYDEDGEEHELEYEENPDAEYDEDDEDQDGEHEVDPENGSRAAAFNKMEPDDGMEWDGQEAERIQQQHQDAMRAAALQDQQQRSTQQQQQQQQQSTIAQQQSMSHPYSQQYTSGPGGPMQASTSQSHFSNASHGSEQSHTSSQQQQESQGPRQQQQQYSARTQPNGDAQAYANGRTSTSSLQSNNVAGPSYGALQPNRVPGEHMRTTSGERSISSSSITSGTSAFDANGQPLSITMSRNSTSSSNGFLPSHIQRDRASSDASANSTVIAGESLTSSDKDKRKSNRSSKGNDSLEAGDEKSGKKRSGVFGGLFSRKDKKDRKSGGEERDSTAGISSEDSYASYARAPGGGAAAVSPAVQAANAGLQPGQSIGMGRSVQERDRAQQEAYQRQFLSPQGSSFDSSALASPTGLDDKKRLQQRPGSLIGPSGSTPMLSVLRVFAGEGVDSDSTFKTVLLNDSTRSVDLQRQALQRFGVNLHDMDKYVLTIKRLEGDERPLDEDEHPLRLFNTLTEILQQGQVTVPSVKRSSVGSISSISSNLSTHPAIARLGNDFSDDHAVKFYISRRDRLPGYVDLNASHSADESARSGGMSDLSASQDNSNVTSLGMVSQDAGRSSHSSVLTGETGETVQSPTARFALRLIIFASDLPEGIVFDPQSNALVPAATLRQRLSGASPEPPSQDRFREKILTFPRNTTVAEVVEEGLDRFGIAEGVVEGGDDVEDRPSRRKSRLHVKYGLAVQAADGERALAPTSKVLEAYPSPPAFKVAGKRRSIDAATLLGVSDDVGAHDPVFVLRQITHAHHQKGQKSHSDLAARALSPTDNMLAAARSPLTSPRLGQGGGLKEGQTTPKGMTPQEIIAAQRAAAAERNAAVLGAQRNAQQGVDVVLSNQARIRSSKLGGAAGKFRYSYVPADGQERDISAIIEEVMKDQALQSSADTKGSSSARSALSPEDARPTFGRRMESDLTTADYASARSFGAESPLSLEEVNFELRGSEEEKKEVGKGDLLDSLLRNTKQDAAVEERIHAVLERVDSTKGGEGGGQHKKETSAGSELSNSRDNTSSLGTGSAGTHATNTTGTMLTPLSTFVNAATGAAGSRLQPTSTTMARGNSSISGGSRSVTPSAYPSVAALSFGADDASLSHLYTIVEAAARRDPKKVRLMTHASMSSVSSSTSPILGGAERGGTPTSRPGSKLSRSSLLDDETDNLRPEVGGLFAPAMPFVEDRKLREAYSGITRELGDIDDSLDSLLADVIRIF